MNAKLLEKQLIKDISKAILLEMDSTTYYNAAKKAALYGHDNLANRFREAGDKAKENEGELYNIKYKTNIKYFNIEIISYKGTDYLVTISKIDKSLNIVNLRDFTVNVPLNTIEEIHKELYSGKVSKFGSDYKLLKFIVNNKKDAVDLATNIRKNTGLNISWRLFYKEEIPEFHEESEEEEKTSPNKFNFEKVAEKTIDNIPCGLVKLKANGTTGYEVYYLQVIFEDYPKSKRPNQSYVIRILKQLRGCKVLPFGNPKLIFDFLKTDTVTTQAPFRGTSNTEAFKTLLLNKLPHVTSKKIIDWCAKEMNAILTEKSFGIVLNPSVTNFNIQSANKPNPIKKIEKQEKTYTSSDKKALVEKAIKKMVADKKDAKYITLYSYDIYENIKDGYKIWSNEEDFAKDMYTYDLYKVDIPKYMRSEKTYKGFSGSWYSSGPTYIESITYKQKPCKEFDSLNLYIKNVLKCKPLEMDDVKKEGVEGKRSTIFSRFGTRLLAHNPEECKQIKQWCQKNKAANWIAELDKKNYTYWGDRFNSYGEDMESEWNGYEESYIIIKFKTPTGKVKVEQEFHIY